MVYSSRVLALVLAVCIALVTTLFLSLFRSVDNSALFVAFAISFSISYLLVFVVLEFLIFREITKIYKLIKKLRKNELEEISEEKPGALNPLKKINEEIYSFADLKQKEIDELRKLEAFRKEFIADVSHELKTPIFAAQGFLHTLLDGAVNDKAVRNKFLKKAAKSLDGLDMLVQDLLTLSHIETGQIKMHFKNVELYSLTQDVFEQLEAKADKKEVTLRIEGEVRKVMAFADSGRISQVMINLISNAIKHSRERGEVLISFKVTKKSVITEVKDFGEGISKEHIPRIFERFYRVDKSRSREKGGTGLGLAIVKHILEGHRSKPKVESIPGKGSTFRFKLSRTGSTKSVDDEKQQ
jgi:two-component system phosphate regulon sensor histidine kinase PhoR